LAVILVSLVAWAVLSNRFSSQAAAVSPSPCSTPGFLTAKTIHRFNLTGAIRSGDFNGDHHLDVVTLTGTNVAILLGDGAGNFATPAFFPAVSSLGFFSLAVGDVNGDSKLDVVAAGFDSSSTKGELSILLGNGAGSLGLPKSLQTDERFSDIVLGDFNGDGKLDLAAASDTGVWVMQGDGTSSFGTAVHYQAAGAFSIKMADFNGDGKTDLVAVQPNSDEVSVLLNDGNGQFSTVREFATSKRPFELLAGDFNGDGKADVITGSFSGDTPNNISVLLGDGAGNLALPINTPTDSINVLLAGDFNGDGKPDLLKATSVGPYGILLGDGAGHFAALREFNLGNFSSPSDAVVGDFNEDGKLDVVTNYMTIALGDGASGLLAARSFRVGNDPASVAAGDFNEDGRRDLVVANSGPLDNDVSLLIQDGTGAYAPAINLAVGPKPTFVAVADFNRDHHLDFVTANSGVNPGTVSIRLGDGAGNFAPANNFPSGFAPGAIVVGDFNKDDKLDLVVANMGFFTVSETGVTVFPASVSILIGDGAGSFAAPVVLNNGLPTLTHQAPVSIAAGDLNNDGKLDLIVANSTNLSVLLGDGTGQFGTAIVYTAPNILTSVVVGDFDKDGKLDVATVGQNSIRPGDGTGHLGAAHDFVAGVNPDHINAGDFNLDGNLDLVVSGVNVILGDGAGNFGPPTAFELSAKSITVDDLNGDGKPDIVVPWFDHITILLNSCGGLISPTPTPTPTPTATPTPSPTPSSAPVLLTEEGTNHAIALDSVTFTRDPFTVRTQFNLSPDQRTRIILFASKLDLLAGENAADVIVQAEDTQGRVFPLLVENVAKVPGFDSLTQFVVKLPDELEGAGNVQVSITFHGLVSNKAVIMIKAGDTLAAIEGVYQNERRFPNRSECSAICSLISRS
jgi:hypothetical protein